MPGKRAEREATAAAAAAAEAQAEAASAEGDGIASGPEAAPKKALGKGKAKATGRRRKRGHETSSGEESDGEAEGEGESEGGAAGEDAVGPTSHRRKNKAGTESGAQVGKAKRPPSKRPAKSVVAAKAAAAALPEADLGLPFRAGKLVVHSLGLLDPQKKAFQRETVLYPIGYTVTREDWSLINAEARCLYICRIVDDGNRPMFEITCGDDTSKQVRAKTTQEAWNVLTKEINLKRGHAAKARSRIKGDNMFGLDEPAILHMIHRLPNSRKCRQYKGLRGAPKQKVISYEPNRDGLDFQDILTEAKELAVAKKPRSKRPKKSRSRNVSPPRLGKSAKTDSRSRRGKAPKSSGAVSAPKRSHSKRSDADALLAAKVKQSRTELAELMGSIESHWKRAMEMRELKARHAREREMEQRTRRRKEQRKNQEAEKQRRKIKVLMDKKERTRKKESEALEKERRKEERQKKLEQDRERRKKEKLEESARRRQAYQAGLEAAKAKRIARKEKEKKKRERARERERVRKDRARRRQEWEKRRERLIRDVGIEDMTLVGDEAHTLVAPKEYPFNGADRHSFPHESDRRPGEVANVADGFPPPPPEALLGDSLSLLEFFACFNDLIEVEIPTMDELARMLYGTDSEALATASRLHCCFLEMLLEEDAVNKVTFTDWMTKLPRNTTTFQSLTRLYLESHEAFVVEYPEVLRHLGELEYCHMPPASKLLALAYLRDQVTTTAAVRDYLDQGFETVFDQQKELRRLQTERKEQVRAVLATEGENSEIKLQCMRLYSGVRRHENDSGRNLCDVFMKLPTEEELPVYYTIIKKPMDMSIISDRIRDGTYSSFEACREDFSLMWKNATVFNEPSSVIHDDALQMQRATDELAEQLEQEAQAKAAEKVQREKEAAEAAAKAALEAAAKQAAAKQAADREAAAAAAKEAAQDMAHGESPMPSAVENGAVDGPPPAKVAKSDETSTPASTVAAAAAAAAAAATPNPLTEEQIRKAKKKEATAAIEEVYQGQIDDLDHQCADVLQCIHGEVLGFDRCFNRYILCRGVGGIIVEQFRPVEFSVPFGTLVAAQSRKLLELRQSRELAERAAALAALEAGQGHGDVAVGDAVDDAGALNFPLNYSSTNALYGPVVLGLAGSEAAGSADGAGGDPSPMDVAPGDVGTGSTNMDTRLDSLPLSSNYSPTAGLYGPMAMREARRAVESGAHADSAVESGLAVSVEYGGVPLVRGSGAARFFDAKSVPVSQHNVYQQRWSRLTTAEEIETLIARLNPEGQRERELLAVLKAQKNRIIDRLEDLDDEATAAQTGRSCDGEFFLTGLAHTVTRDILRFEAKLYSREYFGNLEAIKDMDPQFKRSHWLSAVKDACTLGECKELLRQIFDFLPRDALRKEWKNLGLHHVKALDQWREGLMAVSTLSDLAVHLAVLEFGVAWKKRTTTRKRTPTRAKAKSPPRKAAPPAIAEADGEFDMTRAADPSEVFAVVFAKVRGFRAWPAKVLEQERGKMHLFFFGTEEVAWVTTGKTVPWDEKEVELEEMRNNNKNAGFQTALQLAEDYVNHTRTLLHPAAEEEESYSDSSQSAYEGMDYVDTYQSIPHDQWRPPPPGSGCPNRWITVHECTDWCIERWGENPDAEEASALEGENPGTLAQQAEADEVRVELPRDASAKPVGEMRDAGASPCTSAAPSATATVAASGAGSEAMVEDPDLGMEMDGPASRQGSAGSEGAVKAGGTARSAVPAANGGAVHASSNGACTPMDSTPDDTASIVADARGVASPAAKVVNATPAAALARENGAATNGTRA